MKGKMRVGLEQASVPSLAGEQGMVGNMEKAALQGHRRGAGAHRGRVPGFPVEGSL